MAESLNGVFALLIFVTVALTALSIGLVTSLDLLKSALRRRRVVVIVLLNTVAVPVLGYILSARLAITPGAGVGVLICAICAGGPLGLKATQIARGNLNWSLSLTVVLLILNVITLPLWSALLIDGPVALRVGDLVGVLGAAILLPVSIGMVIRGRIDDLERAFGVLIHASNAGMVLAIAVGIVANASGLVDSLSSYLFLAVLAVVLIAGGAAWLVPDDESRRRASTLGTLNRATSVALLIVGRVFPDHRRSSQPPCYSGSSKQSSPSDWLSIGVSPGRRRWLRRRSPDDHGRRTERTFSSSQDDAGQARPTRLIQRAKGDIYASIGSVLGDVVVLPVLHLVDAALPDLRGHLPE